MHECMQINKYHAVALHLTCMGTSRISGVNVRHGFEQAIFLRRLSTMFIEGLSRVLSESVQIKISKGCPQYFRSVVHSIFGVCLMKISEGCPQYFRSVSNENIRGLFIVFSEYVQ